MAEIWRQFRLPIVILDFIIPSSNLGGQRHRLPSQGRVRNLSTQETCCDCGKGTSVRRTLFVTTADDKIEAKHSGGCATMKALALVFALLLSACHPLAGQESDLDKDRV